MTKSKQGLQSEVKIVVRVSSVANLEIWIRNGPPLAIQICLVTHIFDHPRPFQIADRSDFWTGQCLSVLDAAM